MLLGSPGLPLLGHISDLSPVSGPVMSAMVDRMQDQKGEKSEEANTIGIMPCIMRP